MTTLRFRCWHKKEERMFTPSKILFNLGDGELNNVREGIDGNPLFPDDVFIMQSTGLFDENGKEIFEGDIVTEHRMKADGKTEIREQVIWDGSECCFLPFSVWDSCGCCTDRMYMVEIIGNIYEYPSLLSP